MDVRLTTGNDMAKLEKVVIVLVVHVIRVDKRE